ncbi:hypothetical protein AVEN_46233-1 [Araneus ventricosus]|uniref:Uncharacterized protein n=1 Tax=Araneus ventricosus TaxID=182803 RepID=A0A4Y2M0G2_ARAVE|nr:hypothetical protein AVEN_46233-1 [Araneus ventricosus]
MCSSPYWWGVLRLRNNRVWGELTYNKIFTRSSMGKTDEHWSGVENKFRLGWVKAHIGIKGSEIADTLAKEATTDGIPASLPFPKSFLKKELLQLSLSRWQAEWDSGETGRSVYSYFLTNSCTGPENASNSPLAMGPSPATSRDSVSTLQTTADVGK